MIIIYKRYSGNQYVVVDNIRDYSTFALSQRPFDVGSLRLTYNEARHKPNLEIGDIVTADNYLFGVVTRIEKHLEDKSVNVSGIALTGVLSNIDVFSFAREIHPSGSKQTIEEEYEEDIVASADGFWANTPTAMLSWVNLWCYAYFNNRNFFADNSSIDTFPYTRSLKINPKGKSVNDVLRQLFSASNANIVIPVLTMSHTAWNYANVGIDFKVGLSSQEGITLPSNRVSDITLIQDGSSAVDGALVVSSMTELSGGGARVGYFNWDWTTPNLGHKYKLVEMSEGDANSSLGFYQSTCNANLTNERITKEFTYQTTELIPYGTKMTVVLDGDSISGYVVGITQERINGNDYYFYDIGGY